MASLQNKQFELAGVQWGKALPIFTEEGGFDAGTADPRAQEVPRPMGDGVLFGVDYIDPPTWAWTVGLNATTEAEALALLAPLATVWRNNSGRSTSGPSIPLRYSLAGRTRRVYGRPRRISAPKMDTRIDLGYAQCVLDFKCEDHLTYDDVEQSVDLTLANTSSGGWIFPNTFPIYTQGSGTRQGVIQVDGDAPAHFTATITGPIAAPSLVGSGWAFDINTTLTAAQSVTVDTRAATVLRNDGASLAGALSRRSRIGKARLKGGGQELVFAGSDPSTTARCTVRWRPAHHSL